MSALHRKLWIQSKIIEVSTARSRTSSVHRAAPIRVCPVTNEARLAEGQAHRALHANALRTWPASIG